MSLEDNLHAELIQSTREAKKLGYNPTSFLKILSDFGALETAQRLLADDTASEGFYTLAEKKRLDLSPEFTVVQPRFSELFTDHELQSAASRLRLGRELADG